MAKVSTESIEMFHTPPTGQQEIAGVDTRQHGRLSGLGIIFLNTSGDVVASKTSLGKGQELSIHHKSEQAVTSVASSDEPGAVEGARTAQFIPRLTGTILEHDNHNGHVANEGVLAQDTRSGTQNQSNGEVKTVSAVTSESTSRNAKEVPAEKGDAINQSNTTTKTDDVQQESGPLSQASSKQVLGYFDYKPIKNTVGTGQLRLDKEPRLSKTTTRHVPSTENLARVKSKTREKGSSGPKQLTKVTSTPIDADPASKVARSAAKPFNPDEKGNSPPLASSPKVQNTYKYDPLPQSPGSKVIRVIDLLPTHEAAGITVRMRNVDLNDNPSYEAISYCWGPPVFDMKVMIEGRGFISITPSLRGVLRQLRHDSEIRTIWADAICINQQDVDERNSQVQLMRDVYRKCTRVIAWLGDSTTPSDIGMATVPRVMKALQAKMEQHDPRELRYLPDAHLVKYKFPQRNSAALRCLFHIFERPWFRRVWIIQELALAPQALLLCGAQKVQWQDFVTVTTLCWELFTNEASVAVRSGRYFALYIIQPTKEEAQQDILPNLANLVARSSVAEATDPRDKVFALIGLAKERGTHAGVLAAPDYSLQVEDVYTNFAIENIKTYKSLDVLSLAHRPTTDERHASREDDILLPSWVPNLNKTAASDPLTRLDKIVAPDQEFNQKISAFTATHYSTASPELRNNNKQLVLHGHVVDVITKTGNLMTHRAEDEDLVSFSQRVHNTYLSWESISGARSGKRHPVSPSADPSDLGEPLLNVYWQVINGGVPDGDFRTDYLIPMSPYRVVSAGQRIKSRNCFQILERVTSWIQEAQDWWRIQWGDHPASHLIVPGIVNCRRVGRMKSGRVALVPGGARAGDQVVLLKGGRVPFVLRRKEGEGVYELVGEAYVHGIMSGEVWDEEACREICLE